MQVFLVSVVWIPGLINVGLHGEAAPTSLLQEGHLVGRGRRKFWRLTVSWDRKQKPALFQASSEKGL